MFKYELDLIRKGAKYIAGVDEVGRGALAGPLVIGAVILQIRTASSELPRFNDVGGQKSPYLQINDSKKLSRKKREELNTFIRENALSYAIYEISNEEIDEMGLSDCTQKGFYNVLKKLSIEPDHVLTDAFPIRALPVEKQTNIVFGDQKSVSIAAASIIAKVYRDNLMRQIHEIYPQYGFDRHVGYGTKFHKEMISVHGYCDIHRKTFIIH